MTISLSTKAFLYIMLRQVVMLSQQPMSQFLLAVFAGTTVLGQAQAEEIMEVGIDIGGGICHFPLPDARKVLWQGPSYGKPGRAYDRDHGKEIHLSVIRGY